MIEFGTGGFRGVIGEDFTRDNVRLIAEGLTINKCRDLQRRNAVRRYTPLEDAEHIASPEDSETSELLAAVRSLPDKLHEVVVLHYLEGFSVEETARCLRISVSAVKMRLTRGRQAIKALLGTEE